MKSYKVIILIKAKQKNKFLKKKLLAKDNRIVPFCFKTIILLLLIPFPDYRDAMFYPATQINLILYTYTIDYKTLKVLIKNNFK